MDAAQALADLIEISSQIVHVAILDADGAVLASTLGDDKRAQRFSERLSKLLDEAGAAGSARGLTGFIKLEAATPEGSVFVVRSPTGSRSIAAVTRPEPTVGLVFYDLKHCLRATESPVSGSGPAEGDPESRRRGRSPGARSKVASRTKKADASA